MTMKKKLNVIDTKIAELKVIERNQLSDSRGFFSRIFCYEELTEAGWCKPIMQVNHSYTRKKGTIRGLHFQRFPYAEMKLVTCLKGSIWDVAVDLRRDSPTFTCWHAEELSESNGRALLIPEGFAHGFQSLSNNCELIYFHSNIYNSVAEDGININDKNLSIQWPLDIREISLRDEQLPTLNKNYEV
jgi:dTDP-4-dehydrorhamnose 3,5-epimerase